MNELMTIAFGICFIIIAAILLGMSRRLGQYKRLFQSPLLQPATLQHPKELERSLKLMDDLSFVEKELVIAKCFGRPVKVVKGIDTAGNVWFEGVTYWSAEDSEDWAFHYLRSNPRDDKSIG